MRKAVLLSGTLHLTVILLLVVGLPSFVSVPDVAPPIAVELAELEDLAQKPMPKPKPKPEPEKKPEPAPEPEPEPAQQEAKLPPPTPAPAPEPEPEPEEAAVPEPVPEPPQPEAKPEPVEEAKQLPPEPPRKPELKVAEKKPEKPPEDRLTSILKNVEKLKQQQAAKPAPSEEEEFQAPRPKTSQLEINELARAIQQQMSSCWRVEPGARDADEMVVEIRVILNRDGSVRGQPLIIDRNRMASDPFYRSAAENARRAILSCQPFELPIKRYEVWRDMTLKFDPRSMFGG